MTHALVTGNAPALVRVVAGACGVPCCIADGPEAMERARAELGNWPDLLICVTGTTTEDRLDDDKGLDDAVLRVPRDLAALSRAFARQALPPGNDADGPRPMTQIIHVIDQPPNSATPDQASLAMAAASLVSMVRIGAQQFAPRLRVNAIVPADHTAHVRNGDAHAGLVTIDSRLPLTSEDLAPSLRYLIATPSITGQVLQLRSEPRGSG
ncbi:hypothetical protein [Palleronia pelagia]|uniref:Uncharacterized protein n=1 Tax=Palleronia pelagia TaxID=387096 RepID=A0A1H8EL49_9RHOB|nr:hypothetical protein [Palleronia pelagia]SEN20120.1 hypothetical protein SAMN04488011_10318 [Palleronia pelagia]